MATWPQKPRLLGTKQPRLDGPEKATGKAKYSYDINRPGQLHGVLLGSPHAHAKITKLDISAAEKMPGVKAVHVEIPEGREVYFVGEEILGIAADTEEHALDAIKAVKITFDPLPFFVREEDALKAGLEAATVNPIAGNNKNLRPGNVANAGDFAGAVKGEGVVVHEGEYGVSAICHQCLESHGLVAEWSEDGKNLTVWASTQNVAGLPGQIAPRFQIPATNVKCITHYMGGGFGSKFNPEAHGLICCELARKAKAPVKLMLDRDQEITTAGNRPSAFAKVTIAATKEGQIVAYGIDANGTAGVAAGGGGINVGQVPYVYTSAAIPNTTGKNTAIRLNISKQQAYRAPGHPQACAMTDQPIDDLAAKLGMDPMEMRLKNLPPNGAGPPTSYQAMRATLYADQIKKAAELAEWKKKWHAPGADKGVVKRGIGMGLHTWGGAGRANNDVKITISADGSVLLTCSTQDLGTAERTVLAMVTAEVLGLEPKDITVRIGESPYGRSTGSGGSTTCPGTAPAALNAATAAAEAFLDKVAAKLKANKADLVLEPGKVTDTKANKSTPWKQACAMLGMDTVVGSGDWTPGLSTQGVGGVQIAEVAVDTETGVVRCTKVVAVQDCGLIVNKQGCESQVAGGVVMGVNAALFEERIMDKHTGRQCNPDMEFYKIGGIQDMPEIVVHMIDMPERGVIGIGEPPTISTLAAVGNAIFNAIGVRVPTAPYSPERVLAALATKK